MSKSRGNVITPDSYIAEYGADTTRMYMLFLGGWEEGGDFSDAGISGVARFSGRLWDWVTAGPPLADVAGDTRLASQAERRRHRLIARVTEGIEGLRFHVAIAALMEELSWLREQGAALGREQWQRSAESLVLLLAPLAPYLAEELWARLGQPYSVHQQHWPAWNPALLLEEQIELPVQVNGRLRDRISVPADADQAAITALALASERVRDALGAARPRRVVVVAGRVVNVVT